MDASLAHLLHRGGLGNPFGAWQPYRLADHSALQQISPMACPYGQPKESPSLNTRSMRLLACRSHAPPPAGLVSEDHIFRIVLNKEGRYIYANIDFSVATAADSTLKPLVFKYRVHETSHGHAPICPSRDYSTL